MIVIIDYGLGNLASVLNMFRKIGIREVCVSSDPEIIGKADKLLLPGVGAFDAGISHLQATGLIPLLNERVLEKHTPVLGICLGMHMLAKRSEEGVKPGLGWLDAEVIKFRPDPTLKLKVPHMGWEYINVKRNNPVLEQEKRQRFYFVHSYYMKCGVENDVLATAHFDQDFACAVNRENIFGTQFHPEKSLSFGMSVLSNFSKI